MREVKYKCVSRGVMRDIMTIFFEKGKVFCKGQGESKLEDVKLVQDTGLLDVDGNNIYEGSILKFRDNFYDHNMDDFYDDWNFGVVRYKDNRFIISDFEKPRGLVNDIVFGASNDRLLSIFAESKVVGHIYSGDKEW